MDIASSPWFWQGTFPPRWTTWDPLPRYAQDLIWRLFHLKTCAVLYHWVMVPSTLVKVMHVHPLQKAHIFCTQVVSHIQGKSIFGCIMISGHSEQLHIVDRNKQWPLIWEIRQLIFWYYKDFFFSFTLVEKLHMSSFLWQLYYIYKLFRKPA